MDTELRPFPDVLQPPPYPRLMPFLTRETLPEKRLFLSEMMGVQLLMPGGKEQARNLAIKSDSCVSTLSNGPGEEKPVKNSGDMQGSSPVQMCTSEMQLTFRLTPPLLHSSSSEPAAVLNC